MIIFNDERVRAVQESINLFGFDIGADAKAGDETRVALNIFNSATASPKTKYMKEPAMFAGKCSGYGGKDDSGDRLEWQAYLPWVDRKKVSPKQYAEMYRNVIAKDERGQELLDYDAMLRDTAWAKTTGVGGVPGTAGLSWYMRTDAALFCALPVKTDEVLKAINGGRALFDVYVYNHRTKKWCICKLADYGPHPKTGRRIDLSQFALRTLGAKTDDKLMFYILP